MEVVECLIGFHNISLCMVDDEQVIGPLNRACGIHCIHQLLKSKRLVGSLFGINKNDEACAHAHSVSHWGGKESLCGMETAALGATQNTNKRASCIQSQPHSKLLGQQRINHNTGKPINSV